VTDNKEPHGVTPPPRVRLYCHRGCRKAHLRIDDARKCVGGWAHSDDDFVEVEYILPPKVAYVVTDGAYDDYSVEAVTLSEGMAEYLKYKGVGDDYDEFPLTSVPATFKPKLSMVYQHWMERRRDWGETSFNPLLPDGDRALAYKWEEVLREYEDLKEIFVPKEGNEEGLELHVNSSVHPSTEGQKEGISIHASGIDHQRVRDAYQKIKEAHLKKWGGGE